MNSKNNRVLIWITVFAISMGIFEGAIVIYLREIYYPAGFNFPLTPIDNHIAITELLRELASLFMLLSVGILAGKNLSQRFAWFIYSFAVWDIVYYILLWLVLSWPESLMTWDILFLLPVTWTGPVIAPVIISILMIVLAMLIYHFNKKTGNQTYITKKEWIYLVAGAIIIFVSFIWDYCKFLINHISTVELKSKSFSDKLFDLSVQYIPDKFPWLIYFAGIVVLLFSFYRFYKRNQKLIT